MNFNRLNKYYYLRFRRLRGNPRVLAGGTAIGVLVGLTPTMPLHTLLVIAFTIITRTSTVAGIITSLLVCNPLTYFPIYYFSVSLGNTFTPYEINKEWISTFFGQLAQSENILNSIGLIGNLGYESLIVLVTGGILLALPFALASFYLSLYFFRKYSGAAKRKQKSGQTI